MSTTKRITKRLLAVVLTVMMLMSMVTIGMTSASAAKVDLVETGVDHSGGYIYFDNSVTGWTDSYIQAFIGHDSWSSVYEMKQIANTDLYYYQMGSWGGANYFAVAGATSLWGGGGWGPSNRTNATHYTNVYKDYGFNSGSTYVVTPASSANNCNIDISYKSSGYSALNANQTVKQNIDAATVEISSYKISGNGTSAASSASGTTATTSVAKTAEVTLSYSNMAEGYNFLGWSTDGTAVASDAETYTYVCDGATKTVYAMFEEIAEEESSSVVASSSTSTGEGGGEVDPDIPDVTDPEEKNGTAMDASAWFKADGLYAYASVATGDEIGADAWQRWDNVSGHSAQRYIYLPASASDTEVVIYNNYSDYVELNGVKIDAGCYAIVPYVNGTTYTTSGATTQTVKIMKSDAEGTLFINSADGMTTKNDAGTKSTVDAEYDLYTFMTSGSKNQEAAWAAGAVADADGVDEIANTVKKIKGRGNSTWNLAKKPFNITYDTKISVDGMSGKKWSLLANAQDPSLLRNRLVYDLASEVNMTYACDSRFVDWFVNGDYKGSYQLTQKIEMGKNTVMPDLEEPEVEDVIDEDTGELIPYPKADFDFILELDTKENADSSGDLGFTTTKGQWMTYKTPDAPAAEQEAFMKAKYQAVENALYGGDIATLETLVNLDDFARAYLINEVAKNLDAGVTSCYFTYNSETGMFTTAPVWDYDNALGNSKSIEGRHDADGKMLDVSGPSGWYARDLMHYAISNTLNVFGQACATNTTNAKGETFNDVVLRIWNEEFMPALAVLEGTAEASNDRLDTVAGYMANLKDSGQWNYNYADWDLTANNGWVCDHSSLVMYDYDAEANTYTTSTKSYDQYTLDGQANYAGDWLVSRMNWMAAQYNEAEVEVPDGYITIYFENNWQWPDAKVYYWGSTIGTNPEWNGISLTNVVGQNSEGYDIYEIVIPEDITGLLFNGTGEYGAEQSADITGGWYEGICYYMTYDSATNTKPCGSYDYKVPEETTSAPAETTSAPAETDPTEGTTASKPASGDQNVTDATETTTTETPVAETMTIYFENNWKWTNLRVYWWGSKTGTNPAWNAQEMEYVDTTKDGYDRYVIEVPSDITGLIFNGTSSTSGDEQCADITEGWYDGICYYMDYVDNTKLAKSYKYEPIVEESSSTATVTEPTEATTDSKPASGDQDATESTTESGPDMPTVITVYAINSAKWDEVYAYAWATDPAVAWPGVAMDKTDETVNGFDVYALSFDSAYVNVIFNNNNKGAQTADLTAKDGQYYDIKGGKWYESLDDVPALDTLSTDRYLVGEFNGWSTTANEFKLKAEGESYGYVTLTLEANTKYEFKVIREGTWTTCATAITGTAEGLQFSQSATGPGKDGNATITTTEAGEYVFAFGINNSQLSVTYPGEEVTDPTDPTPDTTVKLAGDFTDPTWGDGAIEMTLVEEGGTVYTTEQYFAAGTYKFKIVEFGEWLGNDGTINNEMAEAGGWTFKDGAGNCTLTTTGGTYTFTFDTATDKLTITAELDEIPVPVYDVTWNEGNFTVNAPATIDEAATLTFTVDAAEDYVIAAVIYNMTKLEAVDGVYTIENVQGDVELLIVEAEKTGDDTGTETPDIPVVEQKLTVMFVDDANNIIAVAKVDKGTNLPAPQAPEKAGYTFIGWSADTSNVQADMLVVAQYKKNAVEVEPATIGTLQIEVTGGTGFTLTVNDNARPQGTSYYNKQMLIGETITVVANNTATDGTFLGWVNAAGAVVSTTETYTFTTSGDDYLKAMYVTDVAGVNMVVFNNTMAANGRGQYIDIQYYAAGDEVIFPDSSKLALAGYDFEKWSMTAEEIQAQLVAGNDVTVAPVWQRTQAGFDVTVNNGKISGKTNSNGEYIFNTTVTVTANTAEADQKFAYWIDGNGKIKSYDEVYSFYVFYEVELTAVYVSSDEVVKPEITMEIFGNANITGNYIDYTVNWNVPASVGNITNAGLIIVNQNDYNENTFYHGSGDSKLFDRALAASEVKASNTYTIHKGSSVVGETYIATLWLIYTDVNGDSHTIYADPVTVEKLTATVE